MAVLFYWEKGKDLNASARERDERDRRQWRKKGSVRSEQTRSIETDREQGDYVCEVRSREAARQNLSISAKKEQVEQTCSFLLFHYSLFTFH